MLHQRVEAIRRLVSRHETKIRFAIAGGINTTLGLALFPILYLALAPLHIHYLFILAGSGVACVVFAFLTNKFFVFRTGGNYVKELSRFILFHLTHIALNLLAVPLLVRFVGVSPLVAQPAFAILIIITSYFWHRHITFVVRPDLLGLNSAPRNPEH